MTGSLSTQSKLKRERNESVASLANQKPLRNPKDSIRKTAADLSLAITTFRRIVQQKPYEFARAQKFGGLNNNAPETGSLKK